MAAPPHIQAAYARHARDYDRVSTIPDPKPAGWIDLSHVQVNQGYAIAVKQMLFEAHHSALFDWKPTRITFAPIEFPRFTEVRIRHRDTPLQQRGRLVQLIAHPFTNLINPSDSLTDTLFIAVAKPFPAIQQAQPLPVVQVVASPVTQPVIQSGPKQVTWPVGKRAELVIQQDLERPVHQSPQRVKPSKKRPHKETQEYTPEPSTKRHRIAKESQENTSLLENYANFIGSDRIFAKKLKVMNAQPPAQSLEHNQHSATPKRQSSSPEKKKNVGWSMVETCALEKALRDIRAEEEERGVQDIMKDTALWNEASIRMFASHGMDRSGPACRSHWSRNGRADSGFDERFKKNPNMLATCVQKPKGGK